MKSVKIFSRSPFSILWWSGTLSSFGDWATLFASVALASYLGATDGNSELTAVVPVIARIIPAFMSSFAGLLADRFNKKNVMIISDLVRMVVVLGLFFTTTLFQLFLINFIAEIFSLIRQPSREAIVPELVKNDYLVKANSLFVVGTYASLQNGTGNYYPGDTFSGSGLKWTNFLGGNSTYNTLTPAGTWRIMGFSQNYQDGSRCNIYVRIS